MPRAVTKLTGSERVDTFMSVLEHPFKAEAQAVRELILGRHPAMGEDVKWAAPTFSCRGYLVTFHLRAREHLMLIFHNGAILADPTGLLQGSYVDRRMAYFHSLDDVAAKRPALEAIVDDWIRQQDAPVPARD